MRELYLPGCSNFRDGCTGLWWPQALRGGTAPKAIIGGTTPSFACAHSRRTRACLTCRAASRSAVIILSHDFVEAALMRRAGWAIRMVPALGGSFEECPPSLLDFAARDRRWCHGNLEHLAL